MLPRARIKHRLRGRLRLNVDARRGDDGYFEDVASRLKEALACRAVVVSPLTGSLIIESDRVDPEQVRTAGRELELFSMQTETIPVVPLAKRITGPVLGADRKLKALSGGAFDLPGIIFIVLVCFGLWELLRGNFRRPPWYTVFWYAFGLFSKTLLDQFNEDADVNDDAD